MKVVIRNTGKLLIAAAGATLFALATLGLGARPIQAAPTQAVPFRSSIAGSFTADGPLVAGTTLTLTGSSLSSHLGAGAYRGKATLTTVVAGSVTDTLVETITAANGDTLTLLCSQAAAEIAPGIWRGSDHWTVTGGTGRFANASGSGTGETLVDFNTHTFAKQASGPINVH